MSGLNSSSHIQDWIKYKHIVTVKASLLKLSDYL